jgi:hypothetical protein
VSQGRVLLQPRCATGVGQQVQSTSQVYFAQVGGKTPADPMVKVPAGICTHVLGAPGGSGPMSSASAGRASWATPTALPSPALPSASLSRLVDYQPPFILIPISCLV